MRSFIDFILKRLAKTLRCVCLAILSCVSIKCKKYWSDTSRAISFKNLSLN